MDASWDQHRDELRMLYLSNDREVGTLKSIMTHMRAKHNFIKSKSQYERQFKKWQFHKNNTATEWKSVHMKIEKRQRQGKKSVVYQSGRLIQAEKVHKAKRHNFRKTEDLFKTEQVPQTPEGFSVCTPTCDDAPYVLINNLPSVQLMTQLGTLVPSLAESTANASHNILDLAPIWQQGLNGLHQNFQVPRTSSESSLVLSMLHASSNNFLSTEQASIMMDSVLRGGNRSIFIKLMSVQTPSTKAIARTLLPSAVISADVEIVRLLLGTGICLDLIFRYNEYDLLSLAAERGSLELIKLLLDYGAPVNPPSTIWRKPALTNAAELGRSDLVRLLIDAGANPNSLHGSRPALQAAVASDSIEVVQLLLDAGADVNARGRLYGETALQVARERNNMALVQLLLARGAHATISETENIDTALGTAVRNGDMTLVQALLSRGADVDGRDICDRSLLCRAASNGNHDLVMLLLSWGASDVISAMSVASRNGHIDIVRVLFEAAASLVTIPSYACQRMAIRASVECGDHQFLEDLLTSGVHIDVDAPPIADGAEWTTPLQTAARDGRIDIVQLLLRFGADVNRPPFPSSEKTVLQESIHSGNIQLVEYLLKSGADVNFRTTHTVTPTALASAAHFANKRMVQVLLKHGSDIAAQGRIALLAALGTLEYGPLFAQRVIETVRLLLAHWMSPTTADLTGLKAQRPKSIIPNCHLTFILLNSELTWLLLEHEMIDASQALVPAVELGDLKLVQLLLHLGADVNDGSEDGSWPVATAVFGNLEILSCLVEHGANSLEKSRALHEAVSEDRTEAARLLIESGADVNVEPQYLYHYEVRPYRTVLQAAAENDNLEIVQLLLEAGAETERLSIAPNEQATALQLAAIAGSIGIVNVLMQSGANVNSPSIGKHGRTALEGAAENGRLDMVQLLLNLEAETRGSRALRFAKREGHEGVVALLLENGFEDVGSEDLWFEDVDYWQS